MNLIAKKALCVALAAYLTAGSAAALNADKLGNITVPFAVKVEAADAANSGSCGKNLTWSLDSDGLLTISGTGDMTNYNSWGSYAPWEDATVNSVVISDGVTSIGEYAFYYCTGLTSVTIGNGVTSIGSDAFSGCTGLTSVTIPDSVTSIGSNAFYGCTGLTKVYYLGGLESWLKIEFDYNSNPCCNGAELYFNNELVTDIVIPESVTSIGSYAFSGCTGLTNITIPNSVTEIGSGAFKNCTGLTSVTIPDSVTSIGSYAFSGCTGLTSATIGNGVTSIGEYAFFGCTGLTSIIIPDGVTGIDSSAFKDCTGLTSVAIPDSVTKIGSYAFYCCTGLISITIPDGVTTIGGWAFCGCTGLTSITIPDSVTSIGISAFYGTAFYNDANNWDNGVLCIGNYLIGTSDELPDEYTVKSGTKVIADCAFFGCSGLTSITIPDSVTSIGSYAFYCCTGLTSIIIPDSVTSIDNEAFYGCPESLRIVGAEGSYAQTFATENGINFEIAEEVTEPSTEPTTKPTVAPTTAKRETDTETESTTERVTVPTADIIASVAGKIDTVKATKTEEGSDTLVAVYGTNAAAIRGAAPGAKIVDKDGKEVSDTAPLATGMKIVLDGKNVEIAVLGDVDGNGEISVTDARLALRQAVSLENLKGVYLLAAQVGNDTVSVSEARKILRAAVGLDSSKDWLK